MAAPKQSEVKPIHDANRAVEDLERQLEAAKATSSAVAASLADKFEEGRPVFNSFTNNATIMIKSGGIVNEYPVDHPTEG